MRRSSGTWASSSPGRSLRETTCTSGTSSAILGRGPSCGPCARGGSRRSGPSSVRCTGSWGEGSAPWRTRRTASPSRSPCTPPCGGSRHGRSPPWSARPSGAHGVASLLLALGSALALVPLAMAAARRTGLVDRPSARKLHPGPTPLLGGGAILGALLGLWDDVRGASPWTRLVVEFLASLALVELTRTQLWFPPFLPVQAARVITALWLVGVTNAANCFDCADGSLAGSGAVIALGIAACAAVAGSDAIDPALALAGALVGFLVYNRPPARIFMGDAGSLPVGLLLGWLGVRVASGTLAAF